MATRKHDDSDYHKLTYEEKASRWEYEADMLGEGFCRDNYRKYAAELRAKGEK